MTDYVSSHNRPATSRTRNVLSRGCSLLLGLMVGLIFAELALHLFWNPEQEKRLLYNELNRQRQYYLYSSNPSREFVAAPSSLTGPGWHLLDFSIPPNELPLERLHETPWAVNVEISAQGFRDRLYRKTPPDGVLRIAGIGDSFTIGEGVPLELSLMKQVENYLGTEFEVLNAGYPGFGTADELKHLRSIAADYHCRRAIVVFLVNDVGLTQQLKNDQDYINDLINVRPSHLNRTERSSWYRGHSRLLYLLGSTFEMQRVKNDTIQWYRDMYDERHNKKNMQRLRDDIFGFAAIPDCRVAFVMYPLIENLDDEYLFTDIHQRVGRMALDAGLPVLDLAPFFQGRDTQALQVHPADHHPNGKAHQIAAEAIVDWLREEVPGFLSLTDSIEPPDDRHQP